MAEKSIDTRCIFVPDFPLTNKQDPISINFRRKIFTILLPISLFVILHILFHYYNLLDIRYFYVVRVL